MTLTKDKAVKLLQKSISNINEIIVSEFMSPNFIRWERNARLAISNIFGENSQHMKEFTNINFSYDCRTGYLVAGKLLESMIEEIEDYWSDDTENIQTAPLTTNSSQDVEPFVKPCVFIGHGRSKLWARLKIFLQDELGLNTATYESESRVGESIIPVLEKMLDLATFAVLVLTAEDETSEGLRRARQNVIHEAGLFQGRLGFRRAVVIRQEGLEDFTNVAGLQYIGFNGDRIEDSFYELHRVLKREGMLSG
jgi:predicted nucleotide-binding protein